MAKSSYESNSSKAYYLLGGIFSLLCGTFYLFLEADYFMREGRWDEGLLILIILGEILRVFYISKSGSQADSDSDYLWDYLIVQSTGFEIIKKDFLKVVGVEV